MYNGLRKKIKEKRDYWVIRRSGLFDQDYYLRNNLDVARSCTDPIIHYLRHGWREGRNPSNLFNTQWYLDAYSDVAESNMNPLYHYLVWGTKENREIQNHLSSGEADIKSLKKHLVPFYEDPVVSIIIPVFNEFQHTYKCILSIFRTVSIPYEIIIGDDCSNDMTCQTETFFSGIKVVRPESNLGFVKNCNFASRCARGKYLMILNNDTEVSPEAIHELVELLVNNPDIGMTGAKLIYPDGKLQEAGGIIWNDGSGWNYGRFENPRLPEFNYLKEVDYISGAGIMIRKKLWEDLRGFDERFAPAYYEDTDLAFAVRKMGFKVVYCPSAEIIHHEGVSCGTDISKGIKAHQVENQKKFIEKWDLELKSQLPPDPSKYLFDARDRSSLKKTIVFVDHYVPTYDQDCGSRSTFHYIQYFLKKGFNVKFVGDSSHRHEPYTTILEKMGVEVFRGPFNEQIQNWLTENNDSIDIVYLHRPHIAIKYIDFFRKNIKATLWYQCHDVHKIRIKRQHKIFDTRAGDGEIELIDQEAHCFRVADISFTFSNFELDYLNREYPEKKIIQLPLYLFHDIPEALNSFEDRKDLLFVGGFAHPPNTDAMLYFIKQVFPLIKGSLPCVKLNIVGSNPPEELKALADRSVVIHGYVNDEQLKRFYQKARLSIIPLRYGAGVKGKVLESLYYGLPLVGTSVAMEGLSDLPSEIRKIYDAPIEMAEAILKTYNDSIRWEKLSELSRSYINDYSSALSLDSIISPILTDASIFTSQ
jgi:GT2 family glycosyltransferase/glycosyltransferase involved in cell wall biosynthesis